MQNPRNRDMMKAFYRLYEKYERYPQGMNREELEAYWMKIGEDITIFSNQYKDCKPMVTQLCLALMNAREEEYKDEWPKATEQIQMQEDGYAV